ncbi:helix-turn-helix domain-containing protein [Leptospira borgpetersenii]|uniref:helix-turn-helix domain-containing protein n=1 Tax=Leptospira borgpetersenii TaxID=174 RepID=UPI000773127F|nr:helix-turn-helix domain-containing protein [Leptospira borgpetersenii]MBE8401708.1 helix-turn-helix transcriptional regulator [Leptospira borgpetersenii serovar Tarassovi]MBE8402437.1 helix-turn-helix transcriptional regulator [Leptospira borgpetersenii serovar Tarassovi]MBE8405625.1 helix-turn-helix transcriptional regulator [Leptospira borgpetersenii serovar Tarassovi]MBE8412231.1 helix-turn-helix transcriptional regulator [Leptospira borgpetersenii serovar Tarassovi]MBE8415607.1 helix-tu
MATENSVKLIGEKIKAVFEAAGISQRQVAQKLNLTPGGLNSKLTGRIESFAPSFLYFINSEFGADLNWLIDDAQPVTPVIYTKGITRKVKDDNQLFNQMKNTEGVKDIIKNLLDLSPQERNTFKDLITQYSTLRKNLKKN